VLTILIASKSFAFDGLGRILEDPVQSLNAPALGAESSYSANSAPMPAASAMAPFILPSGKTAKGASASKPPSFGSNSADYPGAMNLSHPSANGPIEGATNGSAAMSKH
jgi:hypothetical protein